MINFVNYTNQSNYKLVLPEKPQPDKNLNKPVENVEPGKIIKPPNLDRIPKKVLTKQDFIKLFITQLEYQDPMKPIDNNEMAMQLALFNQVDQLFNINDSLKNLMGLAKEFNLGYVSSLIGKEVKVKGSTGWVENGKFLGGEFTLDKPVNKLDITIKDSSGKIIKQIELTDLQKGTHKIDWDATDKDGNKVPDGEYKFIIGIPGGSEVKPITPEMYAKVTGAKLGKNVELVLGNNQTIALDKVEEILGGE